MPSTKRKRVEATPDSQDIGETVLAVSKKLRTDVPPIAGLETNPAHIGNPVEGDAAAADLPPLHAEPQGLLRLPIELQEEIFGYLRHPTLWTTVGYERVPVIPPTYTERNKVLRSLASTCVAYRRVFLPWAWRHVLICTIGEKDNELSYYKTIGEVLARKCKGLMKHPELGVHVQKISVVLTQYQTGKLLPLLASCLESLPSLHTFHVFHANTKMTTSIQKAFKKVSLVNIRTLAVPDYCHEILRSCPNVVKVQCTDDSGSKLVGAVGKCCKQLEEMVGLDPDGTVVKRLVKAAPNLHTLHLRHPFPSDLPLLASLKKLEILKVDLGPNPSQELEERREGARKVLASMPPLSSGKKRQLWYTLHEEGAARYESDVFQAGRRAYSEEKYDTVEYI